MTQRTFGVEIMLLRNSSLTVVRSAVLVLTLLS
jgi:hypothetical protein